MIQLENNPILDLELTALILAISKSHTQTLEKKVDIKNTDC